MEWLLYTHVCLPARGESEKSSFLIAFLMEPRAPEKILEKDKWQTEVICFEKALRIDLLCPGLFLMKLQQLCQIQ